MSTRRSIAALVLLVPAPSIGTLAAMELFPGTGLGKTLFTASKLWLLVFPIAWLKLVDRGRFGLSPCRKGGLWSGVISGTALSALILAGFFAFGKEWIHAPVFIETMREVGLVSWPAYLAGAAYWILVNALLEEYVWRWFVFGKCETLAGPSAAIALSALFFTLHHFIALQTFCRLPLALAGSAGVFLGGAVWSWLYARHRSVWPCYLSHVLVDLAVFGIGAVLLFGNR